MEDQNKGLLRRIGDAIRDGADWRQTKGDVLPVLIGAVERDTRITRAQEQAGRDAPRQVRLELREANTFGAAMDNDGLRPSGAVFRKSFENDFAKADARLAAKDVTVESIALHNDNFAGLLRQLPEYSVERRREPGQRTGGGYGGTPSLPPNDSDHER